MRMAVDLARQAGDHGEIPIGAVVVDPQGVVIGRGSNAREADHDPTAHAEVLALREAGQQRGSWRLNDCTIYVTLEPCPMSCRCDHRCRGCRGLVFGAWNDEYGAAGSRWDLVRDQRLNHQVEVIPGVLESECATVVRNFLADRRK